MNATRYFSLALTAWLLTACASHSGLTPAGNNAATVSPLSELLRPYEILARKTPAAAPPVVGPAFDVAHSVPVPADLGRQVFGTPDAGTRSTSDTEAQAYAMVAVRKAPTSSSRRAVRDGETCYYFVTYLYNVRTGQIVRILSVVFEGCDQGAPPGGDPGGGDPPPTPTPAPLPTGWQMGCNSSTNSATNERNTAMNVTAPQMNASMQTGTTESVNFIARNDTSGQYATLPTISLPQDANGRYNLGPPPPPPAGWTIVAWTHTHPTNFLPTGDPTGVDSAAAGAEPYVNDPGQHFPDYTNTYFSVFDLSYSNSNGLNAYVEVYSALNSAAVQGGNGTYNWGSWLSGGTIGQTTNYTSGTMGAASTWNQC